MYIINATRQSRRVEGHRLQNIIAAPAKPTLCVVNFNGAGVLGGTLLAACALLDRFAAVLVVDNGSTDGSAEEAERDFPAVRVRRLGANLGAGGARNVGMREAPTDLILFIDNDVALTAACIERLLAALERHPHAALAAATVIYAHQRDTIQYDGAECHFLGTQRLLDEDLPVTAVRPGVRKCGSLSTCCFLADRRRIPAGVDFDETYFYIFEDHDFGVRMRLLGAEILSLTDAPCYHGKGTAGLSIRQIGSYSSKRVHYIIRNRWLLLLKNFSLRSLVVLAPILVFYDVAQFFMVLKKGWLREWWSAYVWMWANLPDTLRKRRAIQSARRIPDSELLVGGGAPFRAELATGKLERALRDGLDRILGSYWKLVAGLI